MLWCAPGMNAPGVLFAAVLAVTFTTTVRTAHAQHAGPARGNASMQQLAREVAIDWVRRANAAEQQGQVHAAEVFYHRAVEADPGYLPAHLGYVRILAARGHRDEALLALQRVPPRAFEQQNDLVQLARLRASLGDLQGALDLLNRRPESAEATRARMELLTAAGRFPEALLAARRLAELVQGTPEATTVARMVTALAMLVGEADAVRAPGPQAPVLRRLLAQ